ncbi:Cro/Cl family transcriptional regulator [Faecalibacterium prausnitzii]|uniref:Cro/Cl family transcriptional regulator n=2 Tax=Faecalibacterium TaxID=216851 RepID=A0A2A7AXE3_9FIRM|nr:helix-turn-helix domain-containing protein [Faecalibacterium prausnitzii]PDX83825.1 Cro/Cl family transcriptional regulator [Faecalibacterium prausnitzii]
MRRKQVTQYQLLKNGLDNKTLDTLKKNRNITLSTLEKLCQMLD